MSIQRNPGNSRFSSGFQHKQWLVLMLLCVAVTLSGCMATKADTGVQVDTLSTAHYAPSQTIDVVSSKPSAPYEELARLTLADPTGTATSSQLVAQLSETARRLGASALVVEQVEHAGNPGVAFNPSGGQLQDATATGEISVTALAIRYTH